MARIKPLSSGQILGVHKELHYWLMDLESQTNTLFPIADVPFLVLTASASLTQERVFTPGIGLDAVDSGAGLAYTLNVDVTELPTNDSLFLVLTADAFLTNERVFTLGNGLDAVDSGAGAAYTVTVDETELNHNLLGNLAVGDVHTHYLLLAGRAGGQIGYGGTGAADNLTFYATSYIATPAGDGVPGDGVPSGGGVTGRINLLHPVTMDSRFVPILGEGASVYSGQFILTRVDDDFQAHTGAVVGVNFSSRLYSNDGAGGGYNFSNLTALSGTSYLYEKASATLVNGLVFAGGCMSTGDITALNLVNVATYGTGAGSIGTVYGIKVGNLALYNKPTTIYGIGIGASTTAVGTTKYGLYIGNQAGATTNYSIYTAGGASVMNAGAATVVPLTLRGAAAHSDNLFQVQSSTPVNLIEVDADGKVGINVDPSEKLHMLHSGAPLKLRMDNYQTGGVGTVLEGRRARGSLGSELQVFSATPLLTLDAYGWYDDGLGSAGWCATARASIVAESIEVWTPTAQGTRWTFSTTPSGSIVPVIACRISDQQNLVLNAYADPTSMQFGLAAKLSVAPTALVADSVALYTKDANSAADYSWWHGMGEKNVEHVMVGAIIRTDAGDPTVSHETAMCVNYADDTVKIVREKAWRQFLFTDILSYDDNLLFYDDELVW